MRILFVSPRFPFPPLQGDRVRAYHQLRILSSRHQISLVAPQPDPCYKDAFNSIKLFCKHIEIVPLIPWRRFFRICLAPFSTLPLQTLYFFDPRFRQIIKKLEDKYDYDLVHVQLARMGPAARKSDPLPKCMDMIDSLSLNMERRSKRQHGPLGCLLTFEQKRLKRYEQLIADEYDHLIVSSSLDKETIGNFKNLHVIPNGVDISAFPYIEEGRESNMIIFTGRMRYFPNADAVEWFVKKALPLVRRQKPDVRFFIVGADPPTKVRRLIKYSGVEITGFVAKIQDLLSKATVAIAPMQAGSGMQFKILEAMASGVPVVARDYALGGIKVEDGKHLLIANSPEEFAAKIIELFGNPCLRRHLSRSGRKLVSEKYNWEFTISMLERVYGQAVGISI